MRAEGVLEGIEGCMRLFEPHSRLSPTTPVVGSLPLMRHGQNPEGVFTSLMDEAVREHGEHELADVVGDLRRSSEALPDARESGINLVCEDQSKTKALALVVVDGVIELTTSVR